MKRSLLKICAIALVAILSLGMLVSCNGENGGDTETESKTNIYAVKSGNVTIELGKKADTVLAKLGEAVSEQNTGNCGGLGETIRYDYSSAVIVVVDYEDGDKIIDQIELKNDGAETSMGIYIGSSESSVKAKYGEPDEKVGSALVYTDGDKRLEIGITDGSVASIVLRCK